MAAAQEATENELLQKCRYYGVIDTRIGQILDKCDCCGIREIVDELLQEIDDDVIVDSREIMFKEATTRYITMLESGSYDPMAGVPVLILVKRRQGDKMRVNNCKDLVDLYVYSTGLSDIFPKDTLSPSNSKYIEIVPKNTLDTNNRGHTTGVNEKLAQKTNDQNVTDLTLMAHRIRDQEKTIEELKRIISDLRNVLVRKLDQIDKTLSLAFAGNIGEKRGKVVTHDDQISTQTSNTARPNKDSRDNAGQESNRALVITQQCTSPVTLDEVSPPPDPSGTMSMSLTTNTPGVSTERQHLKLADPNGAVDQAESLTTDDPANRQLYTEAASMEGPWQQVTRQRDRKSRYRDARDKYADNAKHTSDTQHRRGLKLRGAQREPTTQVYVRNIEISDNDNDETISHGIRNYCSEGDVKVMRVHVVYNKYNDYVVGCRLTVPMSNKERIIRDTFWPTNVVCREWRHQAPPRDKQEPSKSIYSNDDTVSRSVTVSSKSMFGNTSWGSDKELYK